MAVTVVLLVLLPHVGSIPVFATIAALLAAVASLAYMPAFAVPLRALPPAVIGAAMAVIIFGGQLAGVVTPLLFGIVTDHFSYATAFVVLAAGPLPAAAVAACVPQSADAFRARLSGRFAVTSDPKESLA
ncbi:hypothetical protein [Nocardia sp. alder85J]|uniref:hypothetical protein n=1 Tax=Nocardia sp. alder85J TaxID=2862949 RepID=UPI001CD75287|nr:hypothetical protein [Nocardia sp. alder85J]MCX4098232.1 hypothetical protein [Nocardia sp. alder85J]